MNAPHPDLLAIARRHAEAESGTDLEAILATMEGEPVYEFHPLARRFCGMAATRRYYRHFLDDVQRRITGTRLLSESVGPAGVVHEYTVTLRLAGATQESTHRIMALLVFGERGLAGERMYCDEAFFRTLLGPVWDELEPIDPDP